MLHHQIVHRRLFNKTRRIVFITGFCWLAVPVSYAQEFKLQSCVLAEAPSSQVANPQTAPIDFNSPDNYIVTQPPRQEALAKTEVIFRSGYQLMLRDFFEIQGRVLSKRIYLGDERTDIAPIDVALGWGKMSDLTFIQKIDFLQNNRFLYWHVNEFPLPRKELEASVSNMHLIPADEEVTQQLKTIKKGQVVSLSGYLVDVKAPDNFIWVSSRSRDDSGDGACEIIFVKAVKIRN